MLTTEILSIAPWSIHQFGRGFGILINFFPGVHNKRSGSAIAAVSIASNERLVISWIIPKRQKERDNRAKPVKYCIVDSVVVIVLDGVVTDRELLEQQTALFEDPDFTGDNPRLVDASTVTELRLSAEMVRLLATNARERGLRRSALVGKSPPVLALLMLYAQHASDATVEVFSDRAPALAWLKGSMEGWT